MQADERFPNGPVDITYEAIYASRPTTADELWERYQKLCNKSRVLPLWGQMRTALKTLYKQGRIKTVGEGEAKRVCRK